MTRRRPAVRALVLAAALLAGATGTARSASGPPVEIHAILSLTGQNAYLGNGELQTLGAVEAVVNASGGIGGRPVRFVVADDETKPQLSVQLANEIIAQKAPVILGLALSANCKAVTPLVTKTGPVVICFTPSIEPAPNGYVFSLLPSTADIIAVGVRYLRERGFMRLAVITSTDATGQYIDAHVGSVLALPENAKVRLVSQEHFNVADLSVAAQIARLKAANPQAIFLAASGTPFGTVLRGLRDAGVDVPVYSDAANMNYDQMTQYAAFLPKDLTFAGTLGTMPGAVARGPVRVAQDRYFRAFQDRGVRPAAPHNHCWDAIMLVVDAYRKLGPDASATQIHDYVEGLHGWAGVNGYYDFRDGGQRGIGENALVIFRWDAGAHDFAVASKPAGRLP